MKYDTLYLDMSDVDDCKGFTNVFYFIYAAQYLGNQCGYKKMIIKRDPRIIQHTENIKRYFDLKVEIDFNDELDTSKMYKFSTVKKVRKLRKQGIDVVFDLYFNCKFRRYGMINFSMYPDEYITGMKLKHDKYIESFILRNYPCIKRSICINIRRGDKLKRKWRTCWDGRGRGFLIVNAKSVKNIIKENKNNPIIFVSDDIKWCKKHFSKYKNVKFLDKCYGDNKVMTDMYALSMCSRIYGDHSCTFSQLGVILNPNRHVNEVPDTPHMFFQMIHGGDAAVSGFYSHKKVRDYRICIDFRSRQHLINCKPIIMDESFNYWFYVNKITNFFKDLFSLKDKKGE